MNSNSESSSYFELKKNADTQLSFPKYHKQLYILCISFRIIFAIYLSVEYEDSYANYNLQNYKLYMLSLMVIGIGYMYSYKKPNWKCYQRNILSNIGVMFLVRSGRNDLASLLYFVDVLMSIQLKHTMDRLDV